MNAYMMRARRPHPQSRLICWRPPRQPGTRRRLEIDSGNLDWLEIRGRKIGASCNLKKRAEVAGLCDQLRKTVILNYFSPEPADAAVAGATCEESTTRPTRRRLLGQTRPRKMYGQLIAQTIISVSRPRRCNRATR
eukprot:6211410-Pleurochrysis_carterae.AAC.2